MQNSGWNTTIKDDVKFWILNCHDMVWLFDRSVSKPTSQFYLLGRKLSAQRNECLWQLLWPVCLTSRICNDLWSVSYRSNTHFNGISIKSVCSPIGSNAMGLEIYLKFCFTEMDFSLACIYFVWYLHVKVLIYTINYCFTFFLQERIHFAEICLCFFPFEL